MAILADLMYSGALQHLNNLHWDPNAEKFELKKKVRCEKTHNFCETYLDLCIFRKTFEDFKEALDEDKPTLLHVPEIIAVDDESWFKETEVPPLPTC